MSLTNTLQFITNHPLTRSHRLAALAKFLGWQISARVHKGKIVSDWVDGSKLTFGRGETGLTGNYYVGLMEFEEMAFLLHYTRNSDVFVDVGANAGAFTVLASAAVGARSIAFEPVRQTYERMQEQIAINGISDMVDARNEGVGASEGELIFTTDTDSTNHVVETEAENTTKVSVCRLRDVLTLDRTHVLKIDVEGFETQVLHGAEPLFDANAIDAIIIEMCGSSSQYGSSDAEIDSFLRNKGFTAVIYDPLARTLQEITGFNEAAENTIYVRDLELARTRCSSSRPYVIHSAFGIGI